VPSNAYESCVVRKRREKDKDRDRDRENSCCQVQAQQSDAALMSGVMTKSLACLLVCFLACLHADLAGAAAHAMPAGPV
jgi:hypothetical protein